MNEILVRNEDDSFFIRFYDFERSVSVDYLQFSLELISSILDYPLCFLFALVLPTNNQRK